MHDSFPTSPLRMLTSAIRNRQLIIQLTKREISSRYRGSVGGVAWSFINPLLLLAIYTFVFSTVFNARWGGGAATGSKVDFALILFTGLIIHAFCAECINTAPKLITSNVNFVKKVVFPIETLAPTSVLNALFHLCVSLSVLLVAQMVFNHSIPLTALLFPLVLLPLILMVIGLSWILSALGAYIRDIGQVTGMAATALLFLSPVFYPISALPEEYRGWLYINPLTAIIENGRATLLFGQIPDLHTLGTSYIVGIVICCLGFAFFQKTRAGFADVL
ncbi:ABC transporter permease [Pseudomonas sp. MCal1]|nr:MULTISPECIES: ABC transporter permease [Pseudomonas]MCX4219523.1 ABC transporter permease [Pseudomonas sp. MCal1]UDI95700.1 ABC transporter permease [Pseudomonas sp. IAC-BECa141]UIN57438.1 ABC transporter permease [Pseudomonas kribbensis]